MKRYILGLLLGISLFLMGCQDTETTYTTISTNPDITGCEYIFLEEYGSDIIIEDIQIPYSDVLSNSSNFICPCKETGSDELIVNDSQLKTHQVIVSFDAIYPIEYIDFTNYQGTEAQGIDTVSIDISINGLSFDRIFTDYELKSGMNRISLENQMVKSVKFVFDDVNEKTAIQDLNFKLGEGYIIKEETELTNAFLRFNGWTGADGIFTFDILNGGDRIGVAHETTAFIFSDTFIGSVNQDTHLRINPKVVNNTFGYLDHTVPFDYDSLSFVYDDSEETPKSVLIPDEYIGSRARNLLDNDGLNVSNDPAAALLTNINEGTMWFSDEIENEVVIDLKDAYEVAAIFLWNYNENPEYGVKSFDLYTSLDGIDFSYLQSYNMDQASGEADEPYTKELIFDSNPTRYLKFVITDTYSEDFVGLGKIMMLSVDGDPLFGEVTAIDESTELTQNEESARLWLQDGIVLGDSVYLFPLLVKDYLTYFQVHSIGMIKMDITNDRFDYENAEYLNSPLMSRTADGGLIYYGAGVMDNRDIDGYIYIYGYKDLDGRHLLVARVTEDDFENFNEWEYYDGISWSHDINDSAGINSRVSAELSMTYINSGENAGKYMLTVMLDTTSGNVAYAISDTPYGDFSEYTIIYNTIENTYLNGAFTYNAKLHPNLSTDNKLIISYNVNSSNFSAFANADIYYPRFISMTEIRKEES